jgi:hypothetical protein
MRSAVLDAGITPLLAVIAIRFSEVDQQQTGRLGVGPERVLHRLSERGSVGQAGQRVVPRGVLVARTLPDRVMNSDHRRQEQRHQQHREGDRRDHDRRQAEHRPSGYDHKRNVVTEVVDDRHFLVDRDRYVDDAGVDQEEDAGPHQERRQLAGIHRVSPGDARDARDRSHREHGGDESDRVLAEVEPGPPPHFARGDVLNDRASALRDQRRAEATCEEQGHRKGR